MYKPNINILYVLFIIIISLNASTAFASVVTLSWDAPITNADGTAIIDLQGYKVYYGTQSHNYDHVIKIGNVTKYMVSNLENGILYYFAITAYDISGNESDFSNEVSGVATSVLECNLIPDTIVIPRGGTLGFQVTLTNTTNQIQSFKFATNATLPNGKNTRYLIKPTSFTLNPYQTRSFHRSQFIPNTAPLGVYTYNGYVGFPGMIYHECWFFFEVTPQAHIESENRKAGSAMALPFYFYTMEQSCRSYYKNMPNHPLYGSCCVSLTNVSNSSRVRFSPRSAFS